MPSSSHVLGLDPTKDGPIQLGDHSKAIWEPTTRMRAWNSLPSRGFLEITSIRDGNIVQFQHTPLDPVRWLSHVD